MKLIIVLFFILSFYSNPAICNEIKNKEDVQLPNSSNSDTPWALPAHVYVFDTKQRDTGIFTYFFEYDSQIWEGRVYRLGAFLGDDLAGPGLTLSLLVGRLRGDPTEVSAGIFYLSRIEEIEKESKLAIGVTARVLF